MVQAEPYMGLYHPVIILDLEDWPDARRSYSGGKFASKGKFGDAGDYAKAASAFLSMEIKAED